MKHKFIAKRYWNTEMTPMGKSADLVKQFDDVINLSLGDPDLTTDERIIQAAFEDAKAGHTHYTNPLGDIELREAIKDYYDEEYGYPIETDECLVTTSGCHAMWLIMETILDDGDEVIVVEPYFTPYPDQIALARGKAVFLKTYEEDEFQIDAARLSQCITNRTKAIIVNTPSNPTGVCLTRESLEKIAQVAIQNDLIVVADDIYTAFSFEEPFIPITTLEGMSERTISIRSFSKDYCMTGWRIGYIIAPAELIQMMKAINENNVFTAPSISQRAAIHALRMRKQIVPEIVAEFKERVDYAYMRIQEINKISVLPPRGSIYLFVNIKETGMSSAAFCDYLLQSCHILAIPGNAFGEAGEGYIRLAMTVSVEVLKQAFDRIQNDQMFQ
ncbi:MAG: pyridoxal phosphate-dependent aminotransferase [Cellulosilyticaceae bacterium]